ncbi:hypothetical protein MNBD_GAMMA11-2621 [hydrothermal vent metagenome]|uniref:Uncharacterized protein n=1 Tax=hydrothermal vent metagenome TaxID=652676 RepID=A0A3B0WTD5_9ZZZZ
MSARYSLLVILVVAALLIVNSLWLSKTTEDSCPVCEEIFHR